MHFVNNIFTAHTTRLTRILSLPASLYIADAELANNLKKLTKFGKNDQAHAGQLSYLHWMNAIHDSVGIIRRHGLIPDISNDSNLKDIFPPLSTLVDHFKANDKTMTKQACIDVIHCYFRDGKDGLLGAVAFRVFNKQSFYKEPTSFIVFIKLFHAEVLRTTHPLNKDAAFLDGGRYHGCKVVELHMRDSLYVNSDDKNNDYRKVEAFSQFRLASNYYLNPRVTAAHMFSAKNTHARDNKKLKILAKKMKLWKTANDGNPYT